MVVDDATAQRLRRLRLRRLGIGLGAACVIGLVVVTERLPWGYWQVGDARYVVDNEGVVLAPAALPDGSPVIKDLSNPVRLVPGDHVDLDAVTLTQSLVTQVPGTLAENIAGVEY